MSSRNERRRPLPSLAVAQGELARFRRTGSLLHLAHARRALEDTQMELVAVRQQALAGTRTQHPRSHMIGPTDAILSSGDHDATRAYLFRTDTDPTVYAVTHDSSGANLPPHSVAVWHFDREFALGVREAMPIHVAPEPVLRGLLARGYFVWCEGSNPVGTSQ